MGYNVTLFPAENYNARVAVVPNLYANNKSNKTLYILYYPGLSS